MGALLVARCGPNLTIRKSTTEEEGGCGIEMKKGVVEGIMDNRTSCYRLPRPIEWDANHSRVMKSINNRITIASERI